MTPTDPAEAALLAAILETPGDDVPRGVLADWLEENARDERCPECRGDTRHRITLPGKPERRRLNMNAGTCAHCRGSGRVSDGRRERAEFVRVQVKLASFRGGQGECLVCREPLTSPQAVGLACEDCRHNLDALRERERELWPEVGQQVVDFKLHQLLFGGDATVAEPTTVYNANAAYVVRRGFVERVSAPLDALLPPCGRCDGGGQRVGADRPFEYGPDAREALRCPDCSGTGRDPGVLRKLFGCQPVTAVTVVGREPSCSRNNDDWFWGGAVQWQADPMYLPLELHKLLGPHPQLFPSRAAALAALSAAVVAYGRSVAGLPPLAGRKEVAA